MARDRRKRKRKPRGRRERKGGKATKKLEGWRKRVGGAEVSREGVFMRWNSGVRAEGCHCFGVGNGNGNGNGGLWEVPIPISGGV